MNQLRVKTSLPVGIAWNWVKFSFATFREKPINFLYFALCMIIFSLLPMLGPFLAVLITIRIYLSADKVVKEQPLNLSLGIIALCRQRNIIGFAIINIIYDMFNMVVLHEIMAKLNLNMTPDSMFNNPKLIYLLVGASILRAIFFGISAVIVAFNPTISSLTAIKLSLSFLAKNIAVIGLALFLLLPLLLIPLYVLMLFAAGISSNLVSGLLLFFCLILLLSLIAISSIFCYKLYRDGIYELK